MTMELAGISPPSMRWDDTNLPEQWEKFMRHTALMFSGPLKAKTEEEKCHICYYGLATKGEIFVIPGLTYQQTTPRNWIRFMNDLRSTSDRR